MSENAMMMGYAVKLEKALDDQHIEELIDNFNDTLLNEWQPFYDESGYEFLVCLTKKEYPFYDGISTDVTIEQMLEAGQSLHKYLDDTGNDYELDSVDIHFFVKIWYTGSDMGSLLAE